MFQEKVHRCPIYFCAATNSDLQNQSERYPAREFCKEGESQRSAACDDLPGCTALAMTNAGQFVTFGCRRGGEGGGGGEGKREENMPHLL